MAQDFAAAFHLGESSRFIDTIDSEGVALAAIKAIYARSVTERAHTAALRKTVGGLRRQVIAQRQELSKLQREVNLLVGMDPAKP
jgi:hypothetical protein